MEPKSTQRLLGSKREKKINPVGSDPSLTKKDKRDKKRLKRHVKSKEHIGDEEAKPKEEEHPTEDAKNGAIELMAEFFEAAWDICSQRFYAKNAPEIISLNLRDTWHRIVEIEWFDFDYDTSKPMEIKPELDASMMLAEDDLEMELFPEPASDIDQPPEPVLEPARKRSKQTNKTDIKKGKVTKSKSKPKPGPTVSKSKKGRTATATKKAPPKSADKSKKKKANVPQKQKKTEETNKQLHRDESAEIIFSAAEEESASAHGTSAASSATDIGDIGGAGDAHHHTVHGKVHFPGSEGGEDPVSFASLQTVFEANNLLDEASSVDIKEYYNAIKHKPWDPQDCGQWTRKGKAGHQLFKVPPPEGFLHLASYVNPDDHREIRDSEGDIRGSKASLRYSQHEYDADNEFTEYPGEGRDESIPGEGYDQLEQPSRHHEEDMNELGQMEMEEPQGQTNENDLLESEWKRHRGRLRPLLQLRQKYFDALKAVTRAERASMAPAPSGPKKSFGLNMGRGAGIKVDTNKSQKNVNVTLKPMISSKRLVQVQSKGKTKKVKSKKVRLQSQAALIKRKTVVI